MVVIIAMRREVVVEAFRAQPGFPFFNQAQSLHLRVLVTSRQSHTRETNREKNVVLSQMGCGRVI